MLSLFVVTVVVYSDPNIINKILKLPRATDFLYFTTLRKQIFLVLILRSSLTVLIDLL